MKRLDDFLNLFINEMKSNSDLKGTKIIRAYPCTLAPAQPLQAVVAAGIAESALSPEGAGEENLSGSVSVFADIFSPWKAGTENISDILTYICESAVKCGAVSVKAERITSDKITGCYVLKSVFTFNGEVIFGGEADE